jgi:hypothetical protein
MKSKKLLKHIAIVASSLALIGCGGGSGSSTTVSNSSPTTTSTQLPQSQTADGNGYYLDSGVEGLKYVCGKLSGFTLKGGEFKIEAGQGCKFYINDFEIRSISNAFNGIKVIEKNITIARLLQTIDADGNASNGITILPEVISKVNKIPISDDEVKELVETLKSEIQDYNGNFITIEDAKNHLMQTINANRPVAYDLSILLNEESQSTNIQLKAVDPQNDLLKYKIIQKPKYGILSGDAPNLIYTPNENFSGSDSFVYRVNDGFLNSNDAVVDITTKSNNNINTAPVAKDANLNINEDNNLQVNLSSITNDADGDSLTYIIVSAPKHGTLSGDAPNLIYTPDTNFNGSDNFIYKVSDGSLESKEATINISVNPVNDAPVAKDANLNINEDNNLQVNLSSITNDADGDSLTYIIISTPKHGTLSGDAPNLIYTPDTNFNGSDNFIYKVSDGSLESKEATINISVNPVNDAPVAENITTTAQNGVEKEITLRGSDVEGQNLLYSISQAPSNGTVTMDGNIAKYTPNRDFNGKDSFKYEVSDGELSGFATVSIDVIGKYIYIDDDKKYSVIDLGTGDINKTLRLEDNNRSVYIVFTNAGGVDKDITVNTSAPTEEQSQEAPLAEDAQNDDIQTQTADLDGVPDDIRIFNNENIPTQDITSANQKSVSEPLTEDSEESEGDQKLFYYYGGETNATLKKIVTTDTAFGTKTLKIWVSDDTFGDDCEKSKCLDQDMIDEMADAFLKDGTNNDIYDWVTNIYGEEWGDHSSTNLIPDNDEITIFLLDLGNDDEPNGGTLGYFWAMENYTKDSYDKSNERIMFFIDSVIYANRGDDGDSDFWKIRLHSTLAHELQHMIHFYQRNVKRGLGSEVWFNEMLSVAVQDVLASKIGDDAVRGIDPTDGTAGEAGIRGGRFPGFNANINESLTLWQSSRSYSIVGSLGAYLIRNYGGIKILGDTQHSSEDSETDAITNAVNENGGDNKTFEDILRDWAVAVILSDFDDLEEDSIFRYNFGGFIYVDYNDITYDIGSINFFNYSPLPQFKTESGTVANTSNYYYKVGEGLSGDIDINISIPDEVKATLITK